MRDKCLYTANYSERETVHAIAHTLGLLRIENSVNDRTRYVIGDRDGGRTINVMRALVKAIPVVTIEWVSSV